MQYPNAKTQDEFSPHAYMHLSPLHLLESCWRAVMPKSLRRNFFVQDLTDSLEAAS